MINRAKLERAGKDNAFVKLLYGKDEAMIPKTIEEQQRIGDTLKSYVPILPGKAIS